ncbi:PEP-CTERM sorting domain-containing protein [Massilia sp. METH4]|uniref:PEP-CTERM sorting domain-containing protein n=1 Tax=Massilia sp. METH4 TaxID=3123041 RepID=UPI0030CE90C0
MRVFAALVLAAVAAVPAHAAIVQYQFTATVTRMHEVRGAVTYEDVDSSSLAGPTISLGDTWTGAFFYDTDQSFGYVASFIQDTSTGLLFDSKLVEPLPQVFVLDSQPGAGSDSVQLVTYDADADLETGSFYFSDFDGTALSGTALPASLDLNAFEYASVSYNFLRGADFDSVNAEATITSLTLSDLPPPVPEPSTYAMLGLGLAALAMTKRWRRA